MKKLAIPILLLLFIAVACNDDDSMPKSQVKVNDIVFDNGDDFFGDIDGDFMSEGGSITRIFNWESSKPTADYNADITSSADGMFKIEVFDADEKLILNKSLSGAAEPDSFSGVTSKGTPGLWTVRITLHTFMGDGSFSMSEGD